MHEAYINKLKCYPTALNRATHVMIFFLLICILDPFLDANRLDSSIGRERLLFTVW